MMTPSALEQQAIQAAKSQNWAAAVTANESILEENPADINALNRLGVAYVQLGQTTKAKTCFNKVLEIDKSNQLAKKHLEKLKNHQSIILSTLPADEQFIEEPGKTKAVELHRLAGKDQLAQLSVGQMCELKSKGRYISVEVGKTYVGSLPEDLSYGLSKLIADGNQYVCYIRSVSPNSCTCSVFLKETVRSKKNEFINSFPVSKNQISALDEMLDDSVPLEMADDFTPLNIVRTDEGETGEDEEKILNFPPEDTPEELPAEDLDN